MKMLKLLLAIIVVFTLACNSVSTNGPAWVRDFEQATKLANSESKPLFVLFTGHGICLHCEELDREVFRTAKFVNATANKYVFVELDSFFGDGPEEEKRKSELDRLSDRYLVLGMPTVLLADSEGLPYSFITGYETGFGPQAYLDLLASAESAKEKRDEFLAAASSKSDRKRAVLLDNALDSVGYQLGEIGERGDDPVLHFYGETIQEILELTDHEGPIADKYLALRKHRDDWFSSEAVFAKLEDYNSTKDYAGAINYIEKCLKTTTSDSIRWRLEDSRETYLEWSERFAEALKNCRRLLALDGITEEHREHYLNREVYNLSRLNRIEEVLAHYDRRIADAADYPAKRQWLLKRKAQMMYGRDPVSQSISIYEAYRAELERGTGDWYDATGMLAMELMRAKRHKDALPLYEVFLSENRPAWGLLEAAENYLALGNYDRARSYIEEAESANQSLADTQRQFEREQFARVAERIEQLRQRLAEEDCNASTEQNSAVNRSGESGGI